MTLMKKTYRYNVRLAPAKKKPLRRKKKQLKKEQMTPRDVKRWQKELGYKTQAEAAEALGISLPTYQDMLKGTSRTTGKAIVIDKRTALACAALAHHLEPYGKK
ncbi:hypothetical protein [Undibacterium sp. TC9W]|uniref:hypothetical protein n=1 Tax=Undibacterium sp. TC9W TaxID=3413053 RepID=UPI003BF28939